MCYSAMCWADYRRYVKEFGAEVHIRDFANMFGYKPIRRRTPRAVAAAFSGSSNPDEMDVWRQYEAGRLEDIHEWEAELFEQTKRKADAERAIAGGKTTKKLTEDVRIAGNKIKQRRRWLEDATRGVHSDDNRVYPWGYVPVMIWEDGRRVVKPMRFKCRPQGWPEKADIEKKGTYNARRDSLDDTWKRHWAKKHAVIVIDSFFEHVWRHHAEGRPLREGEEQEDVVIEFKPNVGGEMILACLWSDWGGTAEDPLLSFAFITDEPPPEVQAAGHDRCVIPIKRGNIDAWLQPNGDKVAMQAILDDRERPYYEHELAEAA